MSEHAQKVILIIGGASGLGLSTATSFAHQHWKVIIADIQASTSADDLVKDQGHHDVHYFHVDVTSWESQAKMFKLANEIAGEEGLHVVALFAGVDNQPSLVDHVLKTSTGGEPVKPGTSCLDINLTGSTFSASLALHYMMQQRDKRSSDRNLIFISSLAGYLDDKHDSTYTASKFGVRGLFRSLRTKAHTELGIRCNLIAPWGVVTPMTVGLMERLGLSGKQKMTMAKAETVVEAVWKCVSDENVVGRAFAIMPEGVVDLEDDHDGAYGGPVLQKIIARRRADGDVLF